MIHLKDFLANDLPDGCAQLIVVDPPYFEVKGGFDFGVWDSFESYLLDVRLWAAECKRILAPNGSLFWWGHAKKIAYSQIILDEFLTLQNSLVWEKLDASVKKGSFEQSRCFAPVTERCLFYSNFDQSEQDQQKDNACVYFEAFESSRLYLRKEVEKIGIKKAAEIIGARGASTIQHWIVKSQWYWPAEYNVEKLRAVAGIFLKPEYQAAKEAYQAAKEAYQAAKEAYQAARRPFNNTRKLLDVLRYSQEAHITGKFDHPTQKPPRLTSHLIEATTTPGGLVVVPFAGSGTECEAAALLGRRFIGYEIDEKYHKIASDRALKAIKAGAQTQLI